MVTKQELSDMLYYNTVKLFKYSNYSECRCVMNEYYIPHIVVLYRCIIKDLFLNTLSHTETHKNKDLFMNAHTFFTLLKNVVNIQ